ncbi:hypothetical protein HK103_003754 [Boothiomyces macroporosus]|uniref:Uncharacterized protein n=1 Tax=Boothiomyces macroporosus TaxID=261099 RepID=A0AAD5UHL7_9FUNG|nr:hypothetical protein HK103_003754 [Boothiomyces macroporosus]
MAPKSSDAVRETIIQWLQVPENFQLITGSIGFHSALISGQKLKKKDAYVKLAQFVNQKHNETFTEREMKCKYDWMLQKFKKANEKLKSEPEIDIQKLEEICPFYKDLDAIFGVRQNINSFSLIEPIIPDRIDGVDNAFSRSLDSEFSEEIINDQSKKRSNQEPASHTKKKQVFSKNHEISSKEKSPFNSKSNSLGKKDLTPQNENWKMEKEYKQQELVLHKIQLDKETEIKEKEVEIKEKEVEIKYQEVEYKQQELQLHKTRLDKEVEIKEKELDANIKLRREEMEFQAKQTKMQLVKEMISQGKSQEEIKELLELLK